MTDLLTKLKTKSGSQGISTIIVCLCSIFVFSLPGSLFAQAKPKATADKTLLQLLASLKKADGYTYTTRVQSTIVGDTQKSPVQTTLNYGSRSAFVMYSKSDLELVFLCSKGQFKVDETHKEVYYKLYQGEVELNEAKQLYLTQITGAFDSIFLTGAIVNRKKLTKTNAEYGLVYPATAAMKMFKIRAKLPGGSPERVEYAIERLLNQTTHPIMITQKLIMDQYSQGMPREVTQLLAESENLLAFLEKKYKAYTFRKI